MDSKLKHYLDKYKINFVEYEHPAVFTVDESRGLKKSIPGLHCKCLFLKDDLGRFYLVGMPADKRLDMKKLRTHLSVKKLHFASSDELFEKLKLTSGSVSIFGLIANEEYDINFILDAGVWNADSVGFHPNVNTSTLVLKHDSLEKFYNSVLNYKKVINL